MRHKKISENRVLKNTYEAYKNTEGMQDIKINSNLSLWGWAALIEVMTHGLSRFIDGTIKIYDTDLLEKINRRDRNLTKARRDRIRDKETRCKFTKYDNIWESGGLNYWTYINAIVGNKNINSTMQIMMPRISATISNVFAGDNKIYFSLFNLASLIVSFLMYKYKLPRTEWVDDRYKGNRVSYEKEITEDTSIYDYIDMVCCEGSKDTFKYVLGELESRDRNICEILVDEYDMIIAGVEKSIEINDYAKEVYDKTREIMETEKVFEINVGKQVVELMGEQSRKEAEIWAMIMGVCIPRFDKVISPEDSFWLLNAKIDDKRIELDENSYSKYEYLKKMLIAGSHVATMTSVESLQGKVIERIVKERDDKAREVSILEEKCSNRKDQNRKIKASLEDAKRELRELRKNTSESIEKEYEAIVKGLKSRIEYKDTELQKMNKEMLHIERDKEKAAKEISELKEIAANERKKSAEYESIIQRQKEAQENSVRADINIEACINAIREKKIALIGGELIHPKLRLKGLNNIRYISEGERSIPASSLENMELIVIITSIVDHATSTYPTNYAREHGIKSLMFNGTNINNLIIEMFNRLYSQE